MRRVDFENMLTVQDVHWWFSGKRKIIDQIIRSCNGGSKLNILEIGAGTGSNLPMLSKYGDITALEQDDYARSMIKPMPGVKIVKGCWPNNLEHIQGLTFDLICLFDVLEHIEDDERVLMELPTFLRPGGKILLSVPAYQWMYSVHDKLLGHYRRYTINGLKTLCQNVGLDIVYSTYFNSLLFPLMVIARIIDRFGRGDKTSSTGSDIPKLGLNNLFKAIFGLESLLIPFISFPFGGSIMMVLESSKNIILRGPTGRDEWGQGAYGPLRGYGGEAPIG